MTAIALLAAVLAGVLAFQLHRSTRIVRTLTAQLTASTEVVNSQRETMTALTAELQKSTQLIRNQGDTIRAYQLETGR